MKLGGWTRAWIVLSVVYALFVALAAYSILPMNMKPSAEEFLNAPTKQTTPPANVTASSHGLSDEDVGFGAPPANVTLRKPAVSTFNPADRPVTPMGTFADDPEVGSIPNTFNPNDKPIPFGASAGTVQKPDSFWPYFRQRELWFALKAFGLWLGGTILLYLMGWSIGWIVRGFRKGI